ncbi:hypothetical protein NCLIV_050490 [Neospora caninum Liverpool]|uniref:non-specific serine/threonine protein kinase n=1 Tax=Neospora caninum (strain Liverpool) TaxID=572307 RepID=F0VKM0_NEOCL|nr:hypothetical protein NCLIV_050490 [Neospora caninum Liverpool]CBZ54621.1 hypothetical protein NCLIV_050490 [Neospora caninum Liverpool]|eukprot:XP_003884651.1 hypothetical protein NCLIV_050490 [Neospora caninum Liverpool]
MQTFKQFCSNWVTPALQFGQRQYVINNRTLREERQISEDVSSGETFALKRILCQEKERYRLARAEAKLMESLPPHPNIVGFFGAAVETIAATATTGSAREVLLLLELCEGGHLLDLLDRHRGSLKEEWILHIIKEITAGLAHLHSQPLPVAHRDLKIENVLCCPRASSDRRGDRQDKREDKREDNRDAGTGERSGESVEGATPLDFCFKLCDFGSSHTRQVDTAHCSREELLRTEDEIERNTTLMYRPPEMVDVYRRFLIGPQVDMWMLGCILYTLCFYRHPFQEESSLAIANANYTVPDNEYSQELVELLHWLLSVDPKDRPTSSELLRVLESSSFRQKMQDRRERVRETRRREGDKAGGKRRAEKKERKPANEREERRDKKTGRTNSFVNGPEQAFTFSPSTPPSEDPFFPSKPAADVSSPPLSSACNSNSSSSSTFASSPFGGDSACAWFPSWDVSEDAGKAWPSGTASRQGGEAWSEATVFWSGPANGAKQAEVDFFGQASDPFEKETETPPLDWGPHTVSCPEWEEKANLFETSNDAADATSLPATSARAARQGKGEESALFEASDVSGAAWSSGDVVEPVPRDEGFPRGDVSSRPNCRDKKGRPDGPQKDGKKVWPQPAFDAASLDTPPRSSLGDPSFSSSGNDLCPAFLPSPHAPGGPGSIDRSPQARPSQAVPSSPSSAFSRRVVQASSPFNARAVSLSFPQRSPAEGALGPSASALPRSAESGENAREGSATSETLHAPFDLFGDFHATSAAAAAAHHAAVQARGKSRLKPV